MRNNDVQILIERLVYLILTVTQKLDLISPFYSGNCCAVELKPHANSSSELIEYNFLPDAPVSGPSLSPCSLGYEARAGRVVMSWGRGSNKVGGIPGWVRENMV